MTLLDTDTVKEFISIWCHLVFRVPFIFVLMSLFSGQTVKNAAFTGRLKVIFNVDCSRNETTNSTLHSKRSKFIMVSSCLS